MNAESITFRLTGTKRLLMHSSRLADPLDQATKDLKRLTSKKSKTEADFEMIGKVEWYAGLWLHTGRPCIPAEALMATFVDAAKLVRRAPQAKAGLVVEQHALLDYDGPEGIDELWDDPDFRLRVPVPCREREDDEDAPRFDRWSVTFTANYLPTLLNREEVKDLYATAGFVRGVGDWRPQNGTYLVEILDG